jgi:carboxymethylenebutenolidase
MAGYGEEPSEKERRMQITSTTIRLRTPDGEMKVHQAQPRAQGSFPAVIVIMEAFGLNDHIKDVAERIAQEGYVTVAPDLYYRESPNVVGYDRLDAAIALMQKLVAEKVMADLGAVIEHLKRQNVVLRERIGITGFCMGGTLTFLAACKFPEEIKAGVSFYGGGIATSSPTAPLNLAGDLQAPLLCLFGEKDPYIPLAEVHQIETTLQRLGKVHEVKIYPDADHGFFCNDRASYHPAAAADAWEKLKGWFERYLK